MPSNQTREQLDERNRIQRIRYANDEELRKKVAMNGKAWRMKNPGARIEQQRQYRADNPEVMNRYNKKRSIKLKIKYATDEKYRQTCRDTGVSNYYRNKKVVHKLLGNKCVCCGENNPIYFNIDHVNNDGHLDKSSVYTLKKYLENPERYQLLCANCNQAKKLNGGKLYKPKKKRKR